MLRVGLLGAGRIGQSMRKRSRRIRKANWSPSPTSSKKQPQSSRAIRRRSAQQRSHHRRRLDRRRPHRDFDQHPLRPDEAATKAGKAVLCEKPVDLSLARAQACRKAAAATKRPVMIGFNRRFDPNFAALKAAVDRGEIGKGELLSITSFDPAPPPVSYVRVSGGLFRDMMIHDFDMACWMMGSLPQKVTAIGTSIVDPEIGKAGDVDTAVVTLRFADGRIAVIKNSRRAVYGYDQRIEFLGSEGLLSAGNVLENTVSKATKAGRRQRQARVLLPRTLHARVFRGMGGVRRGGDQGERSSRDSRRWRERARGRRGRHIVGEERNNGRHGVRHRSDRTI